MNLGLLALVLGLDAVAKGFVIKPGQRQGLSQAKPKFPLRALDDVGDQIPLSVTRDKAMGPGDLARIASAVASLSLPKPATPTTTLNEVSRERYHTSYHRYLELAKKHAKNLNINM